MQKFKKLLRCSHFIDSIRLLFPALEKECILNIATLSFSHKISLIVLYYKGNLGIPIFFWKKILSKDVFPSGYIVSQYREKIYKVLEKKLVLIWHIPTAFKLLLSFFVTINWRLLLDKCFTKSFFTKEFWNSSIL